MARFELAQLNVARLRAPIDSPQLADFVAALDPINAVADRSPGFAWRLQDESGNATGLHPMGEDVIVNMSVWRDPGALQAFVYGGEHAGVMKRRREWFGKMDVYMVLWWVPQGHRPTVEEAIERLELLRRNGPCADAFTFGKLFPAPGAGEEAAIALDTPCPAN